MLKSSINQLQKGVHVNWGMRLIHDIYSRCWEKRDESKFALDLRKKLSELEYDANLLENTSKTRVHSSRMHTDR